jgi:hypothetical protein
MPRRKKEGDPDPDFLPGVTRKSHGHDPSTDKRGMKKELMKLKGMDEIKGKKNTIIYKYTFDRNL